MSKLTEQQLLKRTERRQSLFNRVQEECVQQDIKWGDQSHEDGKWLQILIEELGEACKDDLEDFSVEARRELIQAAAVLIQWIYDKTRKC